MYKLTVNCVARCSGGNLLKIVPTESSVCCRTVFGHPPLSPDLIKENVPKTLKSIREMPGIPILPVVGSWPWLLFNKDWDYRQLVHFQEACFNKYGPIFKMQVPGGGNQVFIRDCNDVQEVFNNSAIAKDPQRVRLEAYVQIRNELLAKIFADTGMTYTRGIEWTRVREIFNELLLQRNEFNTEVKLIDVITLEFCERIRRIRDPYTNEVPDNFMEELIRYAIEGLSYCLMGVRNHSLTEDLRRDSKFGKFLEYSQQSTDHWERTEYLPQTWRYRKTEDYNALADAMEFSLRYTNSVIDRRVNELERRPELKMGTVFEEAFKKSFRNNDLHSTMHDILGAGLEVTPQHMSKVVYCLAKHPDAQQKLRKQVDEVLQPSQPMTSSHLKDMGYVTPFINETLRHQSTAFLTHRIVIEPVPLKGYLVPAGWAISIPMTVMGLDAKNVRKANQFIPERFMDGHNELHPKPFSFIPFSYGTRHCVGQKVALVMLQNLAARLVQNFEIEYNYGDLGVTTRSTLRFDGPLCFTFKDRKKSSKVSAAKLS